jgi:hypothetical protein
VQDKSKRYRSRSRSAELTRLWRRHDNHAGEAPGPETKAPGSKTTKMAKTQGVATGGRCGDNANRNPVCETQDSSTACVGVGWCACAETMHATLDDPGRTAGARPK